MIIVLFKDANSRWYWAANYAGKMLDSRDMYGVCGSYPSREQAIAHIRACTNTLANVEIVECQPV